MATNNEDRAVILSVRHLKQFFKMSGKSKLKAVNNVSFDIYKGEVFGLVGESGCGKTTTGRTIIKLYEPTGGEVIFKGQVIAAGTRWNEKEIKWTKIRGQHAIKEIEFRLRHQLEDATDEEAEALKAKAHEEIAAIKAHMDEVITYQKGRIKEHHYAQQHGVKDFTKKQVAEAKKEWAEKREALKATHPSLRARLAFEKDRFFAIRHVRKTKITNKMQMIFQDPISSLNPRMTVRDIIAEGLKIQGIHDKKYIDQRVIEVLNQVGLLPEHATRYPHEFSGGQRQRIGIARAIVMDPDLIIADEPISALDVSIQAQVINLLNDIRRDMGLSILFIAHDLSVVKYFCDRIGVMYFGRMVELATSEELFRHPLHPYTKSLISAIPLPDPHYERQRKRVTYNPTLCHDYSEDKPSFQEVIPGHFIYCNAKELAVYRKEIEEIDAKEGREGD